jgi:hypothetical protein
MMWGYPSQFTTHQYISRGKVSLRYVFRVLRSRLKNTIVICISSHLDVMFSDPIWSPLIEYAAIDLTPGTTLQSNFIEMDHELTEMITSKIRSLMLGILSEIAGQTQAAEVLYTSHTRASHRSARILGSHEIQPDAVVSRTLKAKSVANKRILIFPSGARRPCRCLANREII